MRILTFYSSGSALPYVLSDCTAALRELGHEVFVFDNTNVTILDWDSPPSRTSEHIVDTAGFDPDLIFTINDIGLLPSLYNTLKIPYAAWYFDPLTHIVGTFEQSLLRKQFDPNLAFIFTIEKESFHLLHERGFKNIEYLPLGANTSLFHPLDASEEFEDAFDAPVSFLGNSGISGDPSGRREKILALSEFPVRLYGDDGWKEILKGKLSHYGHIGERGLQNTIFNRSGINLNLIAYPEADYLPLRTLEIPASGGFLLTEYRPCLEDVFEPGKEVEVFRSNEELNQKVQYYLEHEDERKTIAEAGLRRVLQQHTMKHRMQTIIDRVFGERGPDAWRTQRGDSRELRSSSLWTTALGMMVRGKWENVVRILKTLCSLDPDSSEAVCLLIALLDWRGESQQVERLSKEHVEHLAPEHREEAPKMLSEAYRTLGERQVLNKLHEDAELTFQKAVDLDPDQPVARNNLASMLLMRGNSGAARHHLLKALELKEDYHVTHYNLLLLYARLNQKEEAWAAASRFLQLAPPGEKGMREKVLDIMKQLGGKPSW